MYKTHEIMECKLKYKSLKEFRKSHPKECSYLYNQGLVNQFCEDMGWELQTQKPKGYWTLERCLEVTKNFDSIKDWRVLSGSSYFYARKNNWLDECIAHMKNIRRSWTKESCIEEALKYRNRSEWCKNSSGSYRLAINSGWDEECCSHMVNIQKPRGYWTKERCVEETRKCENKNEFYKSPIYNAALRLNCVKDCIINFKD